MHVCQQESKIKNTENFIEKVLDAEKFIDAINLIVQYNNKVIVYQTGTCKFASMTFKIPSFFQNLTGLNSKLGMPPLEF